ncbi:glutamate--cysteine ligase [Halioxenophilus sp. WMMB6]|uniref:glutamate--cysteine ligase n=1 Tax=Halioxenophilus sp. WMMB6 TaxID=3073815 RepID=UPI00295EA995|nr:glutamate--cysteine ligase [Halioxenophilus sp. WMMB6]
MADFSNLLADLSLPENAPLVCGMMRGVEKESLRVSGLGALAHTPHPKALGSALTHGQITTDFSEALMEFITPPSHQVDAVIDQLAAIHQFTHLHLADEHLWPNSMPCMLGEDDSIPVAQYGSSNVGQMKTIYRLGLSQRYGRKMQTIAGIHYNFSLPSPFWAHLHSQALSNLDMQQFRTVRYFDLIRNFRRYYWLLIYLFGASPAVCGCFVSDRDHKLQRWNESGRTLYLPYATSLRMGDLGYQSNAQKSLVIDYNQLGSYLRTLCSAISTPYPEYAELGTLGADGKPSQLNTSLLQIENEFYSAIRPKRTARYGETALTALCYRGVEYIEVRCVDLNPYEPLGISREQMLLLDIFLLYCCLQPSPRTFEKEFRAVQENQLRTVNRGREPGLKLVTTDGEKPLQQWGLELMDAMLPVAELLDSACGNQGYGAALALFRTYLVDPELTPSARLLHDMREQKLEFLELTLAMAKQHSRHFQSQPQDSELLAQMAAIAEQSLAEQADIESKDDLTFEQYLRNYYAQYDFCSRAEMS